MRCVFTKCHVQAMRLWWRTHITYITKTYTTLMLNAFYFIYFPILIYVLSNAYAMLPYVFHIECVFMWLSCTYMSFCFRHCHIQCTPSLQIYFIPKTPAFFFFYPTSSFTSCSSSIFKALLPTRFPAQPNAYMRYIIATIISSCYRFHSSEPSRMERGMRSGWRVERAAKE